MRLGIVAALSLCCGLAQADQAPKKTGTVKTQAVDLAQHDAIKKLTVEQAASLAKQEGRLMLNGLTTISPKVA